MTTPAHHHRPHRGRMATAVAAAAVLLVVGLVLLATAGSNQPGGSEQAIAGAPSSTSTTPYAPDSPPPAGAAVGNPVSTPGSDARAPSDQAVPVPPPANGADPGAAVPGHPGSSNGAVPGAAVPGVGPAGVQAPGQPGSSSNAAPGDAAGNTVGTTPGGLAGSPGNAAPSGTGGGGSGVSASARAAALAGAPEMAPNTLALPSLGVGPTPLGPVCGEPGGSLEPPVNTQGMLCTWRGSSPPTAVTGEITLAGHINYGRIPGAAFARLAQVHVGDPIYLRGATGGTQVWIARSEFARSKTLPLDDTAFTGPDGPRSLALVSCGGALIPGERSYADNIYVFPHPPDWWSRPLRGVSAQACGVPLAVPVAGRRAPCAAGRRPADSARSPFGRAPRGPGPSPPSSRRGLVPRAGWFLGRPPHRPVCGVRPQHAAPLPPLAAATLPAHSCPPVSHWLHVIAIKVVMWSHVTIRK